MSLYLFPKFFISKFFKDFKNSLISISTYSQNNLISLIGISGPLFLKFFIALFLDILPFLISKERLSKILENPNLCHLGNDGQL